MATFFAAAGKFTLDWLVNIGVQSVVPESERGGWGFVYCYGNRLEVVRPARNRDGGTDLAQLIDIKTDMAMLYIYSREEMANPRAFQPLYRADIGGGWAFCNIGRLRHPERLARDIRLMTGDEPDELLFMYLIERLNPQDPVGSLNETLGQLVDESELNFALLSPDMLIFSFWSNPAGAARVKFWMGKGELLRVITSVFMPDLPGINWNELPSGSVTVIRRERLVVA